MTMSDNIKDVTNSPKDWEDFWHSPEKYGSWDYLDSESEGLDVPNPHNIDSAYVQDIIAGKEVFRRKQSPLND
jgi:hypothetical protein|tara:strand:- start:513 stop:731 length:219 start_codon:yes stop_codon:yes gene_type:complete